MPKELSAASLSQMIERRTWEDGQLRVERQRLLNKYRASDSRGEAYCSISVSNSQRRWQCRCQEADNVSSQSAYRVVTVSQQSVSINSIAR